MNGSNTHLMAELEKMKSEPKENRLAWYFDMLKLPYDQRPYSKMVEEALELTDHDTRAYQRQKEKEVSMPPKEKRNRVVKEVVKPLLKEAGFRVKGQDWWKELSDGWLLIHMKSSHFNCSVTGCSFGFYFNASTYEDIRGEITKQWMYNYMSDLSHVDFLPYAGKLSWLCSVDMYQIDGYQNYLPKDDPLDKISAQIRLDFEKYILPPIEKIHSVSDWNQLYEERRACLEERDRMILNFYHSVCMGAGDSGLLKDLNEYKLTSEELLSHLDWLEIICKNSDWPNEDRVSQIKRLLQSLNIEG